MNSQPATWYRLLLTIYFFAVIGILVKIGLNLLAQPAITASSQIPSLDTNQLEQVTQKLENRDLIDPVPTINLDEFNFGKTEPFN